MVSSKRERSNTPQTNRLSVPVQKPVQGPGGVESIVWIGTILVIEIGRDVGRGGEEVGARLPVRETNESPVGPFLHVGRGLDRIDELETIVWVLGGFLVINRDDGELVAGAYPGSANVGGGDGAFRRCKHDRARKCPQTRRRFPTKRRVEYLVGCGKEKEAEVRHSRQMGEKRLCAMHPASPYVRISSRGPCEASHIVFGNWKRGYVRVYQASFIESG